MNDKLRAELTYHRAQLAAALDNLSMSVNLAKLRLERKEPALRLIGAGIESNARGVADALLLIAQLERWVDAK